MSSIWDRLYGHRPQIEMLRNAVSRHRLAQGYLFAGPPGVGKQTFARTLAQCLFCQTFADEELEACGTCGGCKPFLAGTHPDFHFVGLLPGSRELKLAQFTGDKTDKTQSGVMADLALTPIAGGRKIAIIDDADLMNTEAANSFLKTLEEPPPRTVIMLIASQPDAILSTIRSRCQMLRFGPLSSEDVARLLLERQMVEDPARARQVAELSEGSLTRAGRLLDPALLEARDLVDRELGSRRFGAFRLARKLVEMIESIGSDSPSQRNAAQQVLGFTAEFYRSALLHIAGRPSDAAPPGVGRWVEQMGAGLEDKASILGAMLDRVATASEQIDQNASLPMCLEALFDELSRLSATLETQARR